MRVTVGGALLESRNGLKLKEALQKLLRHPSALSRARSSLAYLPDMSRDSLRGFAHLGMLITLLHSFLKLFMHEL